MPWEKSFNENKAVEAAMLLFWEKGYTDTSMADLLAATKLTKGSFYNAFGSKKAIFSRALLKYEFENHRAVLQKLAATDQPVQAIESLFDLILEGMAQDADKKGCFLINMSLELSYHDEDIRRIVTNAIGEVETFFKQMIELGQMRGDVALSIDPQNSSKALMGTVVAIRVLGRGVYDKAALKTLANQAIDNIKNS